jgi:hypothetical protein
MLATFKSIEGEEFIDCVCDTYLLKKEVALVANNWSKGIPTHAMKSCRKVDA